MSKASRRGRCPDEDDWACRRADIDIHACPLVALQRQPAINGIRLLHLRLRHVAGRSSVDASRDQFYPFWPWRRAAITIRLVRA